jgi:hypothetical protein
MNSDNPQVLFSRANQEPLTMVRYHGAIAKELIKAPDSGLTGQSTCWWRIPESRGYGCLIESAAVLLPPV